MGSLISAAVSIASRLRSLDSRVWIGLGGLAVGLVLPSVCRGPAPPMTPSAVPALTAATATIDALHHTSATLADSLSTLAAALRAAGHPRPVPVRPSRPTTPADTSWRGYVDTLETQLAASQREAAGLRDSLDQAGRAVQQAADSLTAVAGRLQDVRSDLRAATDSVRRIEGQRDALARDLGSRRPWAVGALWVPGRTVPVGGYAGRTVGPLDLRLEVTDGPDEPVTLRLGAGLRF